MSEPKAANIDLERLRRCDEDSFESLVREHERLIAALAQSMGFRGADLDDAVMEVFANAYLALPRFEGRSSLKTWLYRIAIRCLGKLKPRRPTGCAEELAGIAAPATTSESTLETRERNQRIWDAVAALDIRSASAVELYYRQDWSIPQIAQALECPEGTVKTILFRARQALRKTLDEGEVDR